MQPSRQGWEAAHLHSFAPRFAGGMIAGGLAGAVVALVFDAAPAMGALGATASAVTGAALGYAMASERRASWDTAGENRKKEETKNEAWPAQEFWQAEVRRVLSSSGGSGGEGSGSEGFRRARQQQQQQPPKQEADWTGTSSPNASGAASADAASWREMDDYELLGVRRGEPLTPAALATAYRREAMRWHPDHNQQLSGAELKECEARFQQLNESYGRVRRSLKGTNAK